MVATNNPFIMEVMIQNNNKKENIVLFLFECMIWVT
jgi:hypothetical protein